MRARLISLLAAALVAVTVIAAGQPDRPAPGGQPGKGGAGPGDKATSLDGEWTVVSVARDGAAVDGSDKMTVTIKGNVVTFGGAGAGDKSKMRALRLDFGPNGTVRVAEAGADGKFGAGTGGTGTAPGDKGGTAPPAGGKDAQPGGTGTTPGGAGAGAAGTMSGVYVCTPDFLAVSVFATGTGGAGGTGTNPGGTGTTPPAGGTETRPGGAGAQPGGAGAGANAAGPQMKSHVSVILKRAGGTRP